jgi:hypothetical protein
MDIRYDHLSEQAIVELQKLDYNHQLAAKGLNGTLFGACASVLAILVLIFAPAVTGVHTVDGWQLVAIVALLGAAVVFYGAFIFNRALSITAERTKDGVSLAGSTHDLTAPADER